MFDVWMIIHACLVTNMTECKEEARHLGFATELTEVVCIAAGQEAAVAWEQMNSAWRVDSWRCRMTEQLRDENGLPKFDPNAPGQPITPSPGVPEVHKQDI